MPTAPLRYCIGNGGAACQNKVRSGRCAQHEQAHRRVKNTVGSRHGLYRTARWRRLRAQVLADEPLCRDEGAPGCTLVSQEVDHIIPHRGDLILFWSRENLAGRCASCHAAKTRRGE